MAEWSDEVGFDNCKCVSETEKALCIHFDDLGTSMWIPKSQVSDNSEIWKKDQQGTLVISGWFAAKEQLA